MALKKTEYESVGCIFMDQSEVNCWPPVSTVISSGVIHMVWSLLGQQNEYYVLKKQSI